MLHSYLKEMIEFQIKSLLDMMSNDWKRYESMGAGVDIIHEYAKRGTFVINVYAGKLAKID